MAQRTIRVAVWLVLLGSLSACKGSIGDTEGRTPDGRDPADTVDPDVTLADDHALGKVRMRRLTQREYRASVYAALGIDVRHDLDGLTETSLPGDSGGRDDFLPFDNDSTDQTPSNSLVASVNALATAIARAVVNDESRLGSLLSCVPAALDAGCYRDSVATVGRRLLRRPMEDDELASFDRLYTARSADPQGPTGVFDLALQALLQHPEFLHRTEIGISTDDASLVRLTDFELLTRLTFLLYGSPPDDVLLDEALAGTLSEEASYQALVDSMLTDARFEAHLKNVFAMWLGYDQLGHELAVDMRAESDALVQRVLSDGELSFIDLFTLKETLVTPALAEHYGFDISDATPADSGGVWYRYEDSRRGGLLSHASVLSNGGGSNGDNSVVFRGLYVMRRLLCEDIHEPEVMTAEAGGEPLPELTLDCDPETCHSDCIQQHTSHPCASCHVSIDPLGFGLEAFDLQGRSRTHETNKPSCAIRPELGGLLGVDGVRRSFEGPGELGALLVNDERFPQCFTRRIHQFAVGRETKDDRALAIALTKRFAEEDYDVRSLFRALANAPAFRHRSLAAMETEGENQ